MKIFKRNRFTVMCLALGTIIIALAIVLIKLIFPNAGVPVYGNRLDDIKETGITQKTLDNHIASLDNDSIKVMNAHITGKIINVAITTKEQTKVQDAKIIAEQYVALFSEEEIEKYDFNIFLLNESEEATGYPLIGQKSKISESIIYNNVGEDNEA